jgi:CheY-like chemotaxis protein
MACILLIDDDSQILTVLSEALRHMGFEVQIASDGDEGIEFIDSGYQYDLVITDITMPRMNGNEVAKHIRGSNRPDVPIVAITGFDNSAIDRELFNSLLMKPFSLDALFHIVRLLLSD